MKTDPTTNLQVIELDDQYFDEVHSTWLPVPPHWHGDLVQAHTLKIRPKQ